MVNLSPSTNCEYQWPALSEEILNLEPPSAITLYKRTVDCAAC